MVLYKECLNYASGVKICPALGSQALHRFILYLLVNHSLKFDETSHECFLGDPVPKFFKCFRSIAHRGHKRENREIFEQTLKILFFFYIELLPFIQTFLTLSEILTYTIRSDSFFKVNDIVIYFLKYLQVLSEILGNK